MIHPVGWHRQTVGLQVDLPRPRIGLGRDAALILSPTRESRLRSCQGRLPSSMRGFSMPTLKNKTRLGLSVHGNAWGGATIIKNHGHPYGEHIIELTEGQTLELISSLALLLAVPAYEVEGGGDVSHV